MGSLSSVNFMEAFPLPNSNGSSAYEQPGHDSFEKFVTMRTGIDLNQANPVSGKSKPCYKYIDFDEIIHNGNVKNGKNGIKYSNNGSNGNIANDETHSPCSSPSLGSSDVVVWVGEGQLYESPSGKVIAKMDGFDVAKGVLIAPDHIRQFSRKIFWFRDPITNEILTEYKGEKVKPIKYDWQVFDYKRGEDVNNMPTTIPSIVKGPRSVPMMPFTARYAGNDLLSFQCPLFIDLPLWNGKSYQAWEIYSYTMDLTHDRHKPPSVSWTRQGSCPPFIKGNNGVMHFLAHRIDSFDDLPTYMQELVEREYDLFKAPPVDMHEVRLLEEKLMEETMTTANGSKKM